jgi:CubicO group peptidase (beta-lactamase class C family)
MAKFDPLPRIEPEAQGVSSRAIRSFLEAADGSIDSLHGFMLLRHGAVVAECSWKPYRLEGPHMLFSLSKSFTSTAIGLAVSEGRLSVEDSVVSFFPSKLPSPLPAKLAAMKVKHLLSMNTGHDADTTDRIMRDKDPVRAFLALPVEHEPGTHFAYNSGASFMLSAIVQELTGKRVSGYLKPRLFDKIGIEGAAWDRHPCGIDFGGWGLNLRLEDIARFGQLYLRRGDWKGEQVLPSSWVDEASSKHSDNVDPAKPNPESDWQQGYGYQFWRCRHGFYRGDGAFGQLCVVMPELDAVLAVFSGLPDIQAVLSLVWEKLVPGIARAALPPDPAGLSELRAFAGRLALRVPKASAEASTPAAPAAAGGRRYSFAENWAGLDWLSLDFGPEFATFRYRLTRRKPTGNGLDAPLVVKRPLGPRKLRIGYGEWLDGVSWLDDSGPRKASSAGAWTAPDVFTMKVFERETPFVLTIAFRFEGDKLRVEVAQNVNMGPTEFPPIEGRADA